MFAATRAHLLFHSAFVTDVPIYHGAAEQAVRDGFAAYCDFWFPYPPLSLPLVYIPAYFADTYERYRSALHLEMFVFDVAALALLDAFLAKRLKIQPARRAFVLCFYSLLGLTAPHLIYDRLDIAMSVFFLGGLYWFTAADWKKWIGYVFLLGGALVKLLPLFFLPLFSILEVFRRSKERWPRPKAALIPFAVVALPFAATLVYYDAFICNEIFQHLFQHGHRGIQIESNWAIPLIADKVLNGTPSDVDYSYGAFHFLDPHVPDWYLELAKYTGFVLLALFFAVLLRLFRRNLIDTERLRPMAVSYLLYSVILILISTQRVLSPQYMIWMWPLAAMQLALADRPVAVFVGSAAIFSLTYVVFDVGFFKIIRFDPYFSVVLVLRNALLALWTLDTIRRASKELRLHRRGAIEAALS